MSNRAERRRAEREKNRGYSQSTEEIRNIISQAVMDNLERKRTRDQAILMASGPIVKAIYAGAVVVLSENYGFDHDKCMDFLKKLDEKSALCMDSQDAADEVFRRVGIRLNLGEAFNRVEETG